jgi:hypothetical protein
LALKVRGSFLCANGVLMLLALNLLTASVGPDRRAVNAHLR